MAPSLLFLLLVAIGFFYRLSIIIYRLFFHPLSRFPGPKLAAATGLYEFYFDFLVQPGGQFSFQLNRLHHIYGPVVRITPHEIHIKDSSWINILYVNTRHDIRDKYPPAAHMAGITEGTFGTVAHSIHQRRRNVLSPYFSKTVIAQSETLLYDNVDKLLSRIDEDISQDNTAELRLNFLTMMTDNLMAYCFGEDNSWNLHENRTRAENWLKTILAMTSQIHILKRISWAAPLALKFPVWLLEIMFPNMAKVVVLRHNMSKLSFTAIQAFNRSTRDTKPAAQPSSLPQRRFATIFDSILASKTLCASDKLPERMGQEGFEIILAGAETTSQTLATAAYNILTNPDSVLSRLQAELNEAMPDPNSRLPLKLLENLPWLTAVIKESLRVQAIITSRLPVISPEKPLHYKDWIFPVGTPVGMSLRDVLLDPDVFDEPDKFLPERWLSSNPNPERLDRYFVPFSRGSRMCLGMNLAMANLYITLAVMFRRHNFKLHDTNWARDIQIVREDFIGEVSKDSKGVRIKYA